MQFCCLTAMLGAGTVDDVETSPRFRGFVSVQSRGVIAVPPALRRRLHLDEPGAQVEMVEREDGVVELHAQMAVPVAQQWFWTEEWQQREREVDAELEAGRHTTYADAQEFVDSLPD